MGEKRGWLLSTSKQTSVLPISLSRRDLRLDFFRGLALIVIFIDHMPGNVAASFTMHSFGLSDAAEAFVFISGYAAFMAYSRAFEQQGVWAGTRRIGLRVRDLYAAHIILVAVCAGILSIAARYFENPLYYEHVNLTPLSFDPLIAIGHALLLQYQLGYVNILPLYIVLLAWFVALWWLLQKNAALALAVSTSLWLAAGVGGANFPSWPETNGWYFNPFAWQLLFTIGAFWASRAKMGQSLPRSPWLTGVCVAYLIFGFLVAAPWTLIPDYELPRLIPLELLGKLSKSQLSIWRLTHILAVAYLIARFVSPDAGWLRSVWAQRIVDCGRNSLDIFCLATVASFVGFVVLLEAGRTWEYQLAVNGCGIGLMLGLAWFSTHRRSLRAATGATGTRLNSGVSTGPSPTP
jgi:hypothetical protein